MLYLSFESLTIFSNNTNTNSIYYSLTKVISVLGVIAEKGFRT